MAYVSLYEAIRVIVLTTPDAAIAETMTDAWIKRGAPAVETSGARRLVPSPPFQHAARILKQAIKSTDVRVMAMVNGTERAIAEHERDYQLEIVRAVLLHPFGRPPIRDILINADDLRRFALKLVKAPETASAEARAIGGLAAILAAEPDIIKDDAKARLRLLQHSFSDEGFDVRIWPAARIKAGLDPKGKAGRPRKSRRLIGDPI
jgi:hypothetical protein